MKLKIKYFGIIILLIIVFIPIMIDSQTKKIINLTDEEINEWLGVDIGSGSNSTYTNSNTSPSSSSSNSNTVNGDSSAYSSITSSYSNNNQVNNRYKAASSPFFKGIYFIKPRVNDVIRKSVEAIKSAEFGRKYVEGAFRQFEYYFPLFRSELKFAGMPMELMIIPFVETAYNNLAVIDQKKAGLWQLTKELAKRYNLEIDEYVDERLDYEKATKAAILELKRLYSIFNDWELTVMAWSLGEKEVLRIVNKYATGDCWKIYNLGGFGNTRRSNFLIHFYALLDILVNAEYHGFEPPRYVKGTNYYKVLINKAVELERVEKDMNLTKGIMYAYNPQLKQKITPPNYKDFLLKIPAIPRMKESFEIQAAIYNNMPDKVVKTKPEEFNSFEPMVNDSAFPAGLLEYKSEDYYKDEIDTPYSENSSDENLVNNLEDDYLFNDRGYVDNLEDDVYNINPDNNLNKNDDTFDFDSDDSLLLIEEPQTDDYNLYDYEIKNDFNEEKYNSKENNNSYAKEKDYYSYNKSDTDYNSDGDVVYKIKYGDTLWALYKKFGIPYQVIAYYNNIENPSKIYADEVIKIPSESKVDTLIAEMENDRSDADIVVAYGENKSKTESNNFTNNKDYSINKDSEDSVNNDYDISLDYSFDNNEVDKDYKISNDNNLEYLIYVVRKGDTLIQIANRFNVTISEIASSNPDLTVDILPGQRIKIPVV